MQKSPLVLVFQTIMSVNKAPPSNAASHQGEASNTPAIRKIAQEASGSDVKVATCCPRVAAMRPRKIIPITNWWRLEMDNMQQTLSSFVARNVA